MRIIFYVDYRVLNSIENMIIYVFRIQQQQYPSFWPESKTPKKYGPVFTVGHRSHHHYTNIKTWLFEINKKVSNS